MQEYKKLSIISYERFSGTTATLNYTNHSDVHYRQYYDIYSKMVTSRKYDYVGFYGITDIGEVVRLSCSM